MRTFRLLLLTGSVFFLSCWASLAQISDNSEMCLVCHSEEDARFDFTNGRSISVFVDGSKFGRSVHGSFDCSDCHTEFSEDDHPSRVFRTRQEYRRSLSKGCESCHSFEGIHRRFLERYQEHSCVDCHGSHQVERVDRDAENCLGCHGRGLDMELGDGTSHELFCDSAGFEESVHKKLLCVDCHFGFSSEEHPEREFRSERHLTQVLSESCRRCHFDKYTRTLESVHYRLLSQNRDDGPVCADCHGSHSIQSGKHDKLNAARKCQKCHQDVYDIYAGSVHGSALESIHNQDVPVCSDCHEAHRIGDPALTDFRNRIPDLCGNCHANEALMESYGLSTAVLDSYLEDFHGVTLSFYQKEEEAVRHIAVCTDCHGIHDVASFRERDSAEVKQALLQKCQSCHQEATDNFPDTWVSHYEPTLTRAPLVFVIRTFYQLFIPFMLVGLVLQILLHIWRYAFNR